MSTNTRPAVTAYPPWERPFLALIGAPANDAQLRALYFWQNWELGSYPAANNWLGIEASYEGEWGPQGTAPNNSRDTSPGWWNPQGVASYKTMAAGVAALADFIQHGHPKVLAALRDPNATVESIGRAIDSEPGWIGDGAKIIASDSGGKTPVNANAVKYATGHSVASQTAQPGQAGGGSSFYQCDKNNRLIGGLGFTILDTCQAKAIVGSLIMLGGIVVVVGGVALIGFKTPLGQGALRLATKGLLGQSADSRASEKTAKKERKVETNEQLLQRQQAGREEHESRTGRNWYSEQSQGVPHGDRMAAWRAQGSGYQPRPAG